MPPPTETPGAAASQTPPLPQTSAPAATTEEAARRAVSPAALGYRMPAEWEPHAATWLSWPRQEGISFPGLYELIPPVLSKMVAALAESEPVHINVRDAAEEEIVRCQLRTNGVTDLAHVRFFHIPTNEPWCRDHGPIFLTRPGSGPLSLAVLNFDYNAWGWKYPPFDLDDQVPVRVAQALGDLPVFYPGIVLEGGSIDVNGSGTLLTTESCLLNVNRNPTLKKAQIEGYLRDYLAVQNVLWLGDGIEGDDTDGHIDDLTRFVDRATVVTVVEEDSTDPNYDPLQHNLARLREMSVEDGTPLARADPADARAGASRGPAPAGELRELLHREQSRAAAGVQRSRRRLGGGGFARGVSRSEDRADQLPRPHLGTRRVSLPHPAAAGGGARRSELRPAGAGLGGVEARCPSFGCRARRPRAPIQKDWRKKKSLFSGGSG